MAWIRSEEEVDKLIEDMKSKGNGKYITQSVTFKKDSIQQMEMLKFVLMSSESFGGYVKQLIAKEMEENNISNKNNKGIFEDKLINKKDTGNFL